MTARFASSRAASRALPGSAPELTATLTNLIQVSPSHTHFILQGDPSNYPQGLVEPRRTPFGRFHIVVYKPKFYWYDLYFALLDNLEGSALLLGGTILVSAGAALFAVRQGLTPLRAVARDAARIEMSLLHQRLPVDGVPAEISPLVQAMNVALERLAASAARMRRYTANAAHELRTPIAILRARLENLDEAPMKGVLLSDASRLQTILEQMLIATRLTERQATLDQDVDLVKTVREVVLGFLDLAVECDRTIEFKAGSAKTVVRGNQRAIESVVANLIDNALRAEPPKGAVVIRVRDDATVEVVDHGQGIAPSDRDLVFEPFWRKDESTPGTGPAPSPGRRAVNRASLKLPFSRPRARGPFLENTACRIVFRSAQPRQFLSAVFVALLLSEQKEYVRLSVWNVGENAKQVFRWILALFGESGTFARVDSCKPSMSANSAKGSPL